MAALRIILCLFPQNAWTRADAPLSWGIYRNIPFAILGLIVIVLFYRSAKEHKDRDFRWMWLTIVLSFGFYIPVVLWADTVPAVGMLMIPKTCAYVWTVMIGYQAMRKQPDKMICSTEKPASRGMTANIRVNSVRPQRLSEKHRIPGKICPVYGVLQGLNIFITGRLQCLSFLCTFQSAACLQE